jgi:hypothetical protein
MSIVAYGAAGNAYSNHARLAHCPILRRWISLVSISEKGLRTPGEHAMSDADLLVDPFTLGSAPKRTHWFTVDFGASETHIIEASQTVALQE